MNGLGRVSAFIFTSYWARDFCLVQTSTIASKRMASCNDILSYYVKKMIVLGFHNISVISENSNCIDRISSLHLTARKKWLFLALITLVSLVKIVIVFTGFQIYVLRSLRTELFLAFITLVVKTVIVVTGFQAYQHSKTLTNKNFEK